MPFHIYIYQTQIELTQDQAAELDMGEEIEALAASVRWGLPGQPGLVSATRDALVRRGRARCASSSRASGRAGRTCSATSDPDLNAHRLLETWGEDYLTKPPESQIFRQIGV